MHISYRLLLMVLTATLLTGSGSGQIAGLSASIDSVYELGISHVRSDTVLAMKCLNHLKDATVELSPIQTARISYLELRLKYSGKRQADLLERALCAAPDSLALPDSLLYAAQRYLERSMPDKAIPLLMRALNTVKATSFRADKAQILLSEAYRQKQEYEKGIGILDELLSDRLSITSENKSFACNRMAALYNEWGHPSPGFSDSVFKYSGLCLDIAGKINDLPNIAFAQNELSFQYLRKRDYPRALELSVRAVENFLLAGLPYNAMNALINQGAIYSGMKRYDQAIMALKRAGSLCPIQENRNLYMRLYNAYARVYELKGDYRDAYDFLQISHQLQLEFFKDRIDVQINEQSARYDLLVKEQKIREEKKKSEFRQRQVVLLFIILAVVCLAFILSISYLRMRRQGAARQQLIEAIADTEAGERKRIARDLHDGLGPVLSAINHYFQAFLDAAPEQKEMIRNKLREVITEAIDEVSRISHNISPHVLENNGLVAAVNNFIASLARTGKIRVDFQPDQTGRFDLKKELTVYRCITELIHNTIKHADATEIKIRITRKDRNLVVAYQDNGRGFDPTLPDKEGMGLYNIRNRIESFGGKMTLQSHHGKGTNVTIEIPI